MTGGPRPRPLLRPEAPSGGARRATAALAIALVTLAAGLLLEVRRERRLGREFARLRTATALRADLADSRLAMWRMGTTGALPTVTSGASGTSGAVWPPLERALRRAGALAAGESPPGRASRLHHELQRFAESTLALQSDREAGLDHAPSEAAYERAYEGLAAASARLIQVYEKGTVRESSPFRRWGPLLLAVAASLAAGALFTLRRLAVQRQQSDAALGERDLQLIQAQKMEAVGRLAGGIAHDINNYLGAIRVNCDLVAKRPLPPERTVERMQGAIAAVHRASTLISRLLAFSRRQPAQAEVVALNRVVEGLEKILRQHLGERIELSIRLAPDLWAIKIDPAQVEQILVNLLVNAREAMPSGGRLTVETANLSNLLDDGGRRPHPPTHLPADFVRLTVSDTGVGIAPEVLDKIFEPFFTTKEGGSGLGLATVYGIVEQNGGSVRVDSLPGQGTTFRIDLPRCREAVPEAAHETAVRPLVAAGGERILLVEDNDDMREATGALLASAGYRVTAVGGGVEALAALETEGPIDLLITDVVLRGLNGTEVAERVRALRGPLPVIFVSGYSESVVGLHGILQSGSHFLAKPFAADVLLQKIRAALPQGPRG